MFNTSFYHHRYANTSPLGVRILLATIALFLLFTGFFIGLFTLLLSLALIPVIAIKLWWHKRTATVVTQPDYNGRTDDDIITAEYRVVN